MAFAKIQGKALEYFRKFRLQLALRFRRVRSACTSTPIFRKEMSMKFFAARSLAGLSALLILGGLTFARPDSGYHLLNTYKFDPAPGSTTEYFDYVTVDSSARRVYLGRGTAVEVMDADTGALVGYISGFKRQHGVAVASEFNRGFITDGSLAQVTIFDLKT